MNRTEITYGQLDKLLRSFGFLCHLDKAQPPARIYEHKKSGAILKFPPFPKTDNVLDYHLIGARKTLELFGIADPQRFDAKLRTAG
jgi:hypothetical protein